ncbi:MAG TPA: Asp-tRNA(Asn)/Glu-tRNA(Gln) amidotransferase subunit GatC [Candidatus Paceibacterota bacterium]|nr:Asp-tRNA(Asn)/Glu-tRNA(Gln) amidotransferase subunit GatC [Candidatus Paceibacterota bacterium]
MTEAEKKDSSAETPLETVERLSALARIQIPDDRKAALAAEFESIIAYIGQLDELTLSREGAPSVPALHNVFREDADPNETGAWTETIVRAFPAASGNALSVKKIISHD